MKSVVYLELQNAGAQTMIYSNTFDSNMAFLDTSKIFVRSYGRGSGPNASTCQRVAVIGNTFSNNFGCTMYGGGVVTVECLDSQQNVMMNSLD